MTAKNTITEPLVFGLDIGTRSIVGTVGYQTPGGKFVVIAQVAKEHDTRAMMDGQIHDIGAVAQTISKVHHTLEEKTGKKLRDVCIAAAGRVLKTVVTKAKVDFNYETVVTQEHIYSLDMLGVENAYEMLREQTKQQNIKFYCVGYSVIHYYQNGFPILKLEGHKALSIETELIATFLPDEVVDGLYAAVEQAGLNVANLTLEPIAAINVAIPERFRLLNIALVDVGAGTSDISITRDGSIIAYGMIPAAGDEMTECLAKHYLTEFAEAEKIKCQSGRRKQITYHDIMGLSHKIPAAEVADVMDETVRGLTRQIADRILELNGDKSVSAVFIVGGGGKAKGFVESLAEYLNLPQDRVALRGAEVMSNIEFGDTGIKVDSLLVTPIGICLNYYEQKNNFIFVTVNDERLKLYDNSRLSVVDAAMQLGFPNEDLFPKRGKTLQYTVNGEKRMLRGEPGEAAVVTLNGKLSSLNDAIASNDKIAITPSTAGEAATLTVGKLPEFHATMEIVVDGKKVICPRYAQVNGNLVSESYELQSDDVVEILSYYTLEQVLEFMDIPYTEQIQVNHASAGKDTRVYDNFTVDCHLQISVQSEDRTGAELSSQVGDTDTVDETVMADDKGTSDTESVILGPVSLHITVNDQAVTLERKEQYIFVDILDFYPFDTSEAKGDSLELQVNGMKCDFTQPLMEGDQVKIFWT